MLHSSLQCKLQVTDDAALLEKSLEFHIMDKDQYSRDDEIGRVSFFLEPLVTQALQRSSMKKSIQGWFPIYDTLEGLRGELLIGVRGACAAFGNWHDRGSRFNCLCLGARRNC